MDESRCALEMIANSSNVPGNQSMNIDPVKILTARIRVRTLILSGLMTAYIGLSLCFFFPWVAPSLDGRTDQHIAADSGTYLYFADALREGRGDPYVLAALSSFPNTFWFPVLLALVLKSTFAMVVANYAMFFLALALLKRTYAFSMGIFLALLLFNATTTISLLSVNKEMIDLLAITIFLFARRRGSRGLLLLALSLSLFNRFEVCVVMILYLVVESRLNPWRRRRAVTLIAVVVALSVMLPLLASRSLSARFEEASAGGVIVWLDSLEMHYLYGIAVIPKIAENLFGVLVNPSAWKTFDSFSDLANSYVLLFNNLASAVVIAILIKRRRFSVRYDLIYFAVLGFIIMAVSLVIQPRYMYFAYVLLCLQAAEPGVRHLANPVSRHQPQEIANA